LGKFSLSSDVFNGSVGDDQELSWCEFTLQLVS
jgi:hypothetical protein